MLGIVDTITLTFADELPDQPQSKCHTFTIDVEKKGVDFVFWGGTILNSLFRSHIDTAPTPKYSFSSRVVFVDAPSNDKPLAGSGKYRASETALGTYLKDNSAKVVFVVGSLLDKGEIELCFYVSTLIGARPDEFNAPTRHDDSPTTIVKGESWITPLHIDILYAESSSTCMKKLTNVIAQDDFIFDTYCDGEPCKREFIEGIMFRRDKLVKDGFMNIMIDYYKEKMKDWKNGPIEIRNPITLAKLARLLPEETNVSMLTVALMEKILKATQRRFGDPKWQEPVFKKSGRSPIGVEFLPVGDEELEILLSF